MPRKKSRTFHSGKIAPHFLLSITLAAIDQIAKQWAILLFAVRSKNIWLFRYRFFSLTYNPLFLFEIGSSDNYSAKHLMHLVCAVYLLYAGFEKLILGKHKVRSTHFSRHLRSSLIMGGMLGNLYDHFITGSIIDFIIAPFNTWYRIQFKRFIYIPWNGVHDRSLPKNSTTLTLNAQKIKSYLNKLRL